MKTAVVLMRTSLRRKCPVCGVRLAGASVMVPHPAPPGDYKALPLELELWCSRCGLVGWEYCERVEVYAKRSKVARLAGWHYLDNATSILWTIETLVGRRWELWDFSDDLTKAASKIDGLRKAMPWKTFRLVRT